jgi:hypothetical protein
MKKLLLAASAAALLAFAGPAMATPSTVVWTPATTYTQPYLVPHLTYDTYVGERGNLQNDYGLTVGFLPSEKIQGEVGFDLFYPGFTKDFFQLNGKLTLMEGALGEWAPGLSVGVANLGFKKDVSNYGVTYAALGKGFGQAGTIGLGGYYGAMSKLLWTGSSGTVARTGVMASYTSADINLNLTGLKKVVLGADVASGKNWLGAVGAAATFYFTDSIDVLTGPVWFLDKDIYKGATGGNFVWTIQVDVDFDLRPPAPPAPAAPAAK